MSFYKVINKFVFPLVLLFSLHFLSVHVYAGYCVPFSFDGLFRSFLATASPLCTALLSIINHTHNLYGIIVASTATIIVAKCVNGFMPDFIRQGGPAAPPTAAN